MYKLEIKNWTRIIAAKNKLLDKMQIVNKKDLQNLQWNIRNDEDKKPKYYMRNHFFLFNKYIDFLFYLDQYFKQI